MLCLYSLSNALWSKPNVYQRLLSKKKFGSVLFTFCHSLPQNSAFHEYRWCIQLFVRGIYINLLEFSGRRVSFMHRCVYEFYLLSRGVLSYRVVFSRNFLLFIIRFDSHWVFFSCLSTIRNSFLFSFHQIGDLLPFSLRNKYDWNFRFFRFFSPRNAPFRSLQGLFEPCQEWFEPCRFKAWSICMKESLFSDLFRRKSRRGGPGRRRRKRPTFRPTKSFAFRFFLLLFIIRFD